MLKIYHILSWLAVPIIPFVLRWRANKGKEDTARIGERTGKATIARPDGKLVWFHAASMGESTSILPVIDKLLEIYPDINILLTSVTITSARNVGAKLPDRAFHQFAPVDTPLAIQSFLEHWQPDAAFWVESEFWPNMMQMTAAKNIPMVLLNARVSTRSYHRWQKFRSTIDELLDCFSLILAKSDDDASRLKNLGADNVTVQGNLKFSSPALAADPKVTAEILGQVSSRRVWVAASTHAGEEEIVAQVHQRLKETYPQVITIIVPRHSNRGKEITSLLEKLGLRVARRSKGNEITADTDIYLADTMGELGIFYRLTGIVFIGGSLVKHGGQNPFEPALLDCAVLYGPHMDNFKEFCHELEASQGAVKVEDAEKLAFQVDDLMRDHNRQETIAQAALAAVKAKQGVLNDVVDAFLPALTQAGIIATSSKPSDDTDESS